MDLCHTTGGPIGSSVVVNLRNIVDFKTDKQGDGDNYTRKSVALTLLEILNKYPGNVTIINPIDKSVDVCDVFVLSTKFEYITQCSKDLLW